jgi:hypothetical protein
MHELNEIQLQRIVRKKNGLKTGDIRKLHNLLITLSQIPRFELMQTLPLNQFKAEGKVMRGKLGELSLGELVEHGALRISGLPSMGARRLNLLNDVLSRLTFSESESATISASATIVDTPQVVPVTPLNSGGVPRFISTRTQNELYSAIDKVRSSTNFAVLKDKVLEEYWPKEEPRSPFEEKLTIGQLLNIDHGALLRKRSFNERKALSLIKVLNKAISIDGPGDNKDTSNLSNNNYHKYNNQIIKAWSDVGDGCVINGMIKECVLRFNDSTTSNRVALSGFSLKVLELLANVKPNVFILWILNTLYSNETVIGLFSPSDDDMYGLTLEVDNLRDSLLNDLFSDQMIMIRDLLGGIGAYKTLLKCALGMDESSCLVEDLVFLGLLDTVDAGSLLMNNILLKDFYSLDCDRVAYVLQVICAHLPLSVGKMELELQMLLSPLRLSDSLRLLETVAYFDDDSQTWFAKRVDQN